MDELFSRHGENRSTGPVEHVHRVRLPVVSAEDAAVEVARKTFTFAVAQGGGEFAVFPRLPAEIQDMIWRATLEPKTFRARTMVEMPIEGPTVEGYDELDWLLLECDHYRQTHIPIFRVCRRSRAVAVKTFGAPSGDNPVLFNPALDTVSIHGHEYVEEFEEEHTFNFLPGEASEDGEVQMVKLLTADLTPESRAEHDALKPFYWTKEDHPSFAIPKLPKYWVAFPGPFDRARNVVICADNSLSDIARSAATLLPNIEELTVRACLPKEGGNISLTIAEWKEIVKGIIHLSQTEGWWQQLRTIDFERQSWPALIC